MYQETIYDQDGYMIELMTPKATALDAVVVVFSGAVPRLAQRLALQLCTHRKVKVAVVKAPADSWYQDTAVFDALRDLTESASLAYAIGSDMGAYGALRLGSCVHLDHVIALSPVATIDPRIGPMDWRHDEAFDALGSCAPVTEFLAESYTVIFDPGSIEKRHLAYLNIPQSKLAALPMAGTAGIAAQTLREAGCLEGSIAMIVTQGVCPRLLCSLRMARLRSVSYIRALGERNVQNRPGVTLWAAQHLSRLNARPRIAKRMLQQVESVAPELVA